MAELISAEQVVIVPANEASWDDLAAIFGTHDYPAMCHCQRFRLVGWVWRDSTPSSGRGCSKRRPRADGRRRRTRVVWWRTSTATRRAGLRSSREPRTPSSAPLAFRGAVEIRTKTTTASTCFVARKTHRGRGLTYLLVRATIDFARAARCTRTRGLPGDHAAGQGDHVGRATCGARQVFEEAGFAEVTHPTARRFVMRIEFE